MSEQKRTPGVSVVVLTYNQPTQLALILEGFTRQIAPASFWKAHPFEVIVVNDGGEPVGHVVDEFAGGGLDVQCLDVMPPSSKMRLNIARNRGLAASRYWRVLLNDGDSIPCENTVRAHAGYHDRAAVVQSQRYRLEPGIVPGIDDLDTLERLPGSMRFDGTHRRQIPWHDSHGYSCSFPASMVEAIGGWWEPMFHHDSNDIELTGRLDRLGVRFVLDPHAVSTHIHHGRPSTDAENAEANALAKLSRRSLTVFRNRRAISGQGFWLEPKPHPFDEGLANAIAAAIDGPALDFGCGDGRVVQHLRAAGIEADGFDGNPATQQLTGGACGVLDLAQPLQLWPRPWVVSLEVGEHIPARLEGEFLDNIAQHATQGAIVSWAKPDQGGHGHVNERPAAWVVAEMAARGFDLDAAVTDRLQAAAGFQYHRENVRAYRRRKQ